MPHGPTYEKLVAQLVAGLLSGTAMSHYTIASGAGNKILGASGYKHQIDLSVTDSKTIYFFELKCLQRSIGVEEILVLASRQADILANNPNLQVFSSMVSMRRPSRNVPGLAKQFGIQVEVVQDLTSYGISFSGSHFVGHVEKLMATDSMDAEVVRANGA